MTHCHDEDCDYCDNRNHGYAHNGEVPSVESKLRLSHGSRDRGGKGHVFFLLFPYREFNWQNWKPNREHFQPPNIGVYHTIRRGFRSDHDTAI